MDEESQGIGRVSRPTVVVGIDGSEESLAACRYALADARRRRARLVAVRAFDPPESFPAPYRSVDPPSPEEVIRNVEEQVRADVVAVAAESGGAGDVEIEVVARPGAPLRTVLRAAEDADLLVVGHRGRGPVASAVLGSVGLGCVLHARCPVTVVPAPRPAIAPAEPHAEGDLQDDRRTPPAVPGAGAPR